MGSPPFQGVHLKPSSVTQGCKERIGLILSLQARFLLTSHLPLLASVMAHQLACGLRNRWYDREIRR